MINKPDSGCGFRRTNVKKIMTFSTPFTQIVKIYIFWFTVRAILINQDFVFYRTICNR